MTIILNMYHHHWQNSAFGAIAVLRRFFQTCLFPSWIRSSGFYFFWISSQLLYYIAVSPALAPTPDLEDQVSVCMSSTDKVAQLYPRAPVSLFVAHDSQGDGGGILTRLRT